MQFHRVQFLLIYMKFVANAIIPPSHNMQCCYLCGQGHSMFVSNGWPTHTRIVRVVCFVRLLSEKNEIMGIARRALLRPDTTEPELHSNWRDPTRHVLGLRTCLYWERWQNYEFSRRQNSIFSWQKQCLWSLKRLSFVVRLFVIRTTTFHTFLVQSYTSNCRISVITKHAKLWQICARSNCTTDNQRHVASSSKLRNPLRRSLIRFRCGLCCSYAIERTELIDIARLFLHNRVRAYTHTYTYIYINIYLYVYIYIQGLLNL